MGYYDEQTTQNLTKQKQTSKPKNPDQSDSDMGYSHTKYKQVKKNPRCPTISVEIPEEHHHTATATHKSEAVRFWSCPLCRNRGRTIPFRPCMPRWAQTCGKILSQVGLEPTTSWLRGWCSTNWATAPGCFMCNNCGMSPKCGYAVYSQ